MRIFVSLPQIANKNSQVHSNKKFFLKKNLVNIIEIK